MLAMRPCEVDDCPNGAAEGGLCWGHAKQRQRGHPLGPITPRNTTPWGRLVAAALSYADADSEDDAAYDAACQRLRSAATRYVTALPSVVGTHVLRPHRARRRQDARQGSLFG